MRSTEIEKEKRVYEVASLMLKGITRRQDILQFVAKNHNWNVESRQIDYYIRDAKDLIKQTDYSDLDLQLNKSLNQLDDLIYKNLNIQDYREVRNCIKAKSELLGLITTKIDNTHKIEPTTIKWGDSEIKI